MNENILLDPNAVRTGLAVLFACGAVWSLVVATLPILRQPADDPPSAVSSAIQVAGAASWALLALFALPDAEPTDASSPTAALFVERDSETLKAEIDASVEEYFAKIARRFHDALGSPGDTSSSSPSYQHYRVQPGDSLSSIASECYGDQAQWRRILEANPWITPSRLMAGEVLALPLPPNES
ncbi:MAG: LysM domain-containing protein [Planctomycetota bacterium]